MGISWSRNSSRRNYQNPPHPFHHPHPQFFPHQTPYYYPPLPPPQYPSPNPNYYYPGWYSTVNYSTTNNNHHPMIGRGSNYQYGDGNGWVGTEAAAEVPVHVEQKTAKKVKNDVNVRKETISVELDEENPDQYLVSFVFDALFDGSITIYYFAKEEANCTFMPIFPEAHVPVKIPFQKGLSQKFKQPSGTGIDLGFFELEDLAKPSPEEDVYPLVISAEVCSTSSSTDDESLGHTQSDGSPCYQITQAVLEKKNSEPFQVKVMRQILQIDGVRYELRDLYGIGSSASQDYNDEDPGKECVICMTEPKDTAVLPCRHMCMCSECAKELRMQSDKCPICRQPIEELMEIKLNNANQ